MIRYLPVTDSIPEAYPTTLMVTGDQDFLVQADQSRVLAKQLGAHLIRLKGVGQLRLSEQS